MTVKRTENNDVQGLQNVRNMPGEEEQVDVVVETELAELVGVV
jgi:hypothetical protein